MAAPRLLRFPGGQRRDPAVQRWLQDCPAPLGEIARRSFAQLRACGAEVVELMHDGAPTACLGEVGFAYVNAYRAHVNLGFFRGAELGAAADPAGLLEGSGRFMRHVKLRPGAEPDAAALTALIAAAYAQLRAQLAA